MGNSFKYNTSEEPIVISKVTLDIILKQDKPSDLMALYTFYYYTAKWQCTNLIKATTSYTAKGLQWGEDRVRKTKKKLIELNLIEDQRVTYKDSGKVKGFYINVKFIWYHPENHPQRFRGSGFDEGLDFEGTNALQTNSLNALKTGKEKKENNKKKNSKSSNKKYVDTSMFDKFWELYPKRTGSNPKSKAYDSWEKICKLPIKSNTPLKNRPTWKQIKKALKSQSKSEQWQNPQYVPMATTWLNQYRWNDSVETSKSESKGTRGYKRKNHKYKKYDSIV